MAYPISQEVLALFERQNRQVADIKVNGIAESLTLSEKDISGGGFTIDRYCVSGSRIEIGSAVAAELTLTLDNRDGRFDDTIFEGAELFVRVGIKKWDARRWENAVVHYIPMGYFTVDSPPRKLSSISLSALDRMVLFDKECKPEDISFPININTLLVRVCSICGVTLATDSSTLTNSEYIVDSYPESENLTYRQILMWIAEITGTCAYIDWNGHLRLEWYGEESSATLSPDMRYSSDLNDKTITITGVQITASDETVYLQGTNEYAFNIESNGLLQKNIGVVATALNEKLNGFTYTPYSCVAKPLVHLYPLDRVDFVDKKGNKVSSIVTNATFTMNSNLSLQGQGETETSNGYAKANPITKQEAAIINKIKNVIDTQITTRQQAIIDLNNTIVNSLGLYVSEEVLENNSIVYYYHDQPEKENSSIIYTFRAGGFAWTDKWEGEDTVWQNGIDRNGNAVLNILSTFQINSEHIKSGSITADRLAVDFTKNIATHDDLSDTTDTLRQEFKVAEGELTSKIIETRNYAEQQSSTINQTSERISAVVSSEGKVQGSAIIEAINGESTATIEADKINFEGQELNIKVKASNIEGQINAEQINADGLEAENAKITGDITINSMLLEDCAVVAGTDTGTVAKEKIKVTCRVSGMPATVYVTAEKAVPEDVTVSVVANKQIYSNIMAKGTNTTSIYIGTATSVSMPSYIYIYADDTYMTVSKGVMPYTSGNLQLGAPNHRWKEIYADTSAINTSDEREKNSISEIPQEYSDLFYKLKPVIYKMNNGTSDRFHTGFIAQSVEEAMSECCLDSKDFAGLIKSPIGDDFKYGLRYSEFIALAVLEIQKLNKKIANLQEKIEQLTLRNEGV